VTQTSNYGFKIKGWWRKGDIRTTHYKKHFEYWTNTSQDVPEGTQDSIKKALVVPHGNRRKDEHFDLSTPDRGLGSSFLK
jgi:hypothetical protein